MMKNILFLSAGRRVELIEAFRAEIKSKGVDISLFATELNPGLSPACQVVDHAFKAPRVTDPSYLDFVLDVCRRNNIGLVIPTIDTELILLSKNRQRFSVEGIELVVSSEDFVSSCRDKRITSSLFEKLGIDTPRIFSRGLIEFPCFAKPYDGSCSVGASLIEHEGKLSSALLNDEKMMFMEYIDSSFSEYTIDAYYARNGGLKCIVPRQRIEVRAGEVSKGVTRKNFVYDYLLPRMGNLEGARGCITLQLFANEASGKFAALEINPRFGGGFPLSYSAGANYPGWLIDEYILGEEVPFFDSWEDGLLMLRYDAKVLVHGYE